jgi:16S rRNA (guanine966-N2)-methyltransferase
VRIIAGKHKGRPLSVPPGTAVRPTSDRAREALFDILAHGRFADGPAYLDAMVLDAFAGTGAFGLEALSRGARHVTFLEKDRDARAALTDNVRKLGETAHCTILGGDALKPPRGMGPCNLVFLDPPYNEDLAASALAALASAGWIAEDALVIVEVAAKQAFAVPAGFAVLEERKYGAARLVFARRAA